MAYSDQKVEDAVLALLGFFASKDGQTWKRYEFSVMESLHAKGLRKVCINRRDMCLAPA